MSFKNKMTAIANKTREKLGIKEMLGLDEIAESVDKVYKAGQQNASRDDFIDSYIDYGNRTDFTYAFAGIGWNDNNFKLNYPIQPTTAEGMFFGSKISYIDIDFSKCTNLAYLFRNSSIVEVKEVNANSESASGLLWIFGFTPIETIGLLKVKPNVVLTNAFFNCYDLKNITIDG